MKRKFIFLILVLSLCGIANAQNQNWFFGGSSVGADTSWNCTLRMQFSNDSILFTKLPPIIAFDFESGASTSASDQFGKLLLSSDGARIYDSSYQVIQNGSQMNGSSIVSWQTALLIPWPGHPDSILYIFGDYATFSYDTFYDAGSRKVYMSVIDMHSVNGGPSVVEKNTVLLQDTLLLGNIKAIRHANGRDFWFVFKQAIRNTFYFYLLDSTGLYYHHKQTLNDSHFYGQTQTAFSPDGNWYARYETNGTGLPYTQFDLHPFDRCSGQLGSLHRTHYEAQVQPGGVSFSQNSRFCYVSVWDTLYQYDLIATDPLSTGQVVAVYDGFLADIDPDTGVYWAPTRFFSKSISSRWKDLYQCPEYQYAVPSCYRIPRLARFALSSETTRN